MNQFVKDLKTKLKAKNLRGLALDIDDTLTETGDYWVKSLQEKFPNPENLTIEQLKKKYRYTFLADYWATKEVQRWEKYIRHSNKVQEQLPIIENANHLVEKVNRLIPIVAYLTARSSTVVKGTKSWLTKHGFPKAELIYRPKNVRLKVNTAWKAKVLEFLYPQVIGTVDDNPELVDNLSKDYPGTIFLYGYSKKSPRTDINVIPAKSWQEVLEKVRALA